jgi:streptogramin lyase
MILASGKFQPYVSATASLPHYIDEYNVPTTNAAPLALTVDPGGNVWFTESNQSRLGRFDPKTDVFTEYKVPGVGDMWGIAIGANGNVWLTQYSLKGSVSPGGAIEPNGTGRLIRFDPDDGNFTVINVPRVGAFPFRVITDRDGKVWFTELLGNRIGSYDPSSGILQEYAVPTEFAGPADLTFDNKGTLWFSEAYNGSIAKFDVDTKTLVEYHLSAIDPTQYVGSPVGISVASDGMVWVADHGGNWIVEFNSTSQRIIRYPTHEPPPDIYPISIPNDLAIDGQGRVWFAEHGGNSVGFLDPRSQRMVEYAIPTGPISTALWIALAPNGDVWFTEWSADKLGVVHANLPVPLTIFASENYLSLQAGGQESLSATVSVSQGFVSNGTFAYSWPSYNPADLNVTFSPSGETLTGPQSASGQVRITVSPNTPQAQFPLALGFDAGTLRVWTMIQTEVSIQESLSTYLMNNLWLPAAAVVVALIVGLEVRRRSSFSKRAKVARAKNGALS